VNGEVVEEVQGLGAVDEEVVDPHGDQVDADRVVPIGREGDLELGADAVGRRNEHGLAVARRDGDEGREGADAAQHLRALRGRGEALDAADRLVAGADVHAG
jgi:hypothetical protein